MAAIYYCPKNLPEAKLGSFRLMVLAEIPGQPSTDCVVWLLVMTFLKIYEKGQVGREETQNGQFEKKRRRVMVPSPVLKEIMFKASC